MGLTCPDCDSIDILLYDDNDATFPETRVEFFLCQACTHEFRQVLVA